MDDPETTSPLARSVAVILPAAGSGRRFGNSENKLFAPLAGRPLWYHSAARLVAQPQVARLIMPIAARDRSRFESQDQTLIEQLAIELVDGGSERSDSVQAGLRAIGQDPSIGWVAIHDAARPLVRDQDLQHVFRAATVSGAAILATPVTGTLKRGLPSGQPAGESRPLPTGQTVDRSELWVAMTPQVFAIDLLRTAYQRHRGRAATDDAQLVERIGHPVTLVPGASDNLKITHPEDLAVAAAILQLQASHDNKT